MDINSCIYQSNVSPYSQSFEQDDLVAEVDNFKI